MNRMYVFRLYPNANQSRELAAQMETSRIVYNTTLRFWNEYYRAHGRNPSATEAYRLFSTLRNLQIADMKAGGVGPHWLARLSSLSLRDTIGRLENAFHRYFRRLALVRQRTPATQAKKRKARVKPPGLHSRNRHRSIPCNQYKGGFTLAGPNNRVVFGDMSDDAPLGGHKLRVFGVGHIRVKLHRPVKGKIKAVAIKREAGKWYVVFSCDLGEVAVEPSKNPPVGIDVGLEHFLTTSDGEHVANPRLLKNELPELRRRQRVADRRGRKYRGNNYRKARRRVAKLHARIRNARRDFHHKEALKLVRRFGVVCAERLNVKGLIKSGKYPRSVSDAGWSAFLAILKSKAAVRGVSVVEVDPRGTSQECSGCGVEVPKDLRVRRHDCPHCGLSMNRDHNAAVNILRRGCPDENTRHRIGPAGRNVGSAVGADQVSGTDLKTERAPQVLPRKGRHGSRLPPVRRRKQCDSPNLFSEIVDPPS